MSDQKKDGGPAFPVTAYYGGKEGMSLRDWFAGQALVGISELSHTSPTELAEYSYRLADAMLEARK
jgi:uncharacterized protein YodC (DUF2158 family)